MAAALVVFAAGWLWGTRDGAHGPTSPTASDADAVRVDERADTSALTDAGDVAAADTPSRTALRVFPPLPGVLSPAELIDRLLPQARAGDAAAACRLAHELAECRNARHWRSPGDELMQRQLALVDSNDLAQLKNAERQLAWYAWQDQRKRECDALPAAIRDAGPQLMLQAAQQGSRNAMVGYAAMRGVGGQEIVANPELYAQYRQHAFPMWQQAFESGSIDALQVWMSALSSNGFQFFAGVVPEDYQDLQLAQALMMEVQAELQIEDGKTPGFPRIEATIDPQTARRARELFDRHFRNSPGMDDARKRLARVQEQREAQGDAPLLANEQWAQRVAQVNDACGGQSP